MKRAGTKLLVTDGGERPALAIVRSLARHGASVLVGSDRPVTLASASKYCARTVTYPSPLTDRDRFAEFVDDLAARESIDVVLPVTDVTTHAICMATDKLRSVTALAVPSLDAFEFVSDKWKLVESAARTGVPTPRTLFVNGVTSLSEIIAQVEYPAVVKPSRSRIPTARGWMATTVHYARSREELLGLYRNIEYLAAHPSLIQERIVGPGVGIFLLFDRGRPIAEFAHRRLREKPPSGGVSVL